MLPSQHHSSSFTCTLRRFGVLVPPKEKISARGHCLTTTLLNNGNLMKHALEQNLLSRGKQISSKIPKLLNAISSFASPSSSVTISSSESHSSIFIVLSLTKLLDVVEVINFIIPLQFLTIRNVKQPNVTEEGTKFTRLEQRSTFKTSQELGQFGILLCICAEV